MTDHNDEAPGTRQAWPDAAGYAAPPAGYAQPGPAYPYAAAPATGRGSWGLMFLLFIPFPIINIGIAIIGVLNSRRDARKSGSPQAMGNANAASNFILSYVIYFVLLVLFIILIGVTMSEPGEDPSPLIFVPILLLGVTGIWGLTCMIVGVAKSGEKVVRAAPVIPFFR